MAIDRRPREAIQTAGEHSRGTGRCSRCGRKQLRTCPECHQQTLHDISIWSAYREEVCENGCTKLERSGFVLRFQAEMKEALYQLEKEEQERKH